MGEHTAAVLFAATIHRIALAVIMRAMTEECFCNRRVAAAARRSAGAKEKRREKGRRLKRKKADTTHDQAPLRSMSRDPFRPVCRRLSIDQRGALQTRMVPCEDRLSRRSGAAAAANAAAE